MVTLQEKNSDSLNDVTAVINRTCKSREMHVAYNVGDFVIWVEQMFSFLINTIDWGNLERTFIDYHLATTNGTSD